MHGDDMATQELLSCWLKSMSLGFKSLNLQERAEFCRNHAHSCGSQLAKALTEAMQWSAHQREQTAFSQHGDFVSLV